MVSYIGSSADDQGNNTTNLSLTWPAHAAGDLGIICAFIRDTNTATMAITGFSGYTAYPGISPNSAQTSDGLTWLWYKVFTSASETNPTITNDEALTHFAACIVLRGVDQTTPIPEADSFDVQDTVAPTHDPVLTVGDNGALVAWCGLNGVNMTGVVAPSGYTLVQSNFGSNRNYGLAYNLDYGTAGSKTIPAWQNTGTDTGMDGHTIAIAISPPADTAVPGIQVIRNIPGVAF